jgi:hypothetical protein
MPTARPPFSGYTGIGGGGGGGGAPANASYLVLGLDATLTDERVFSPTARFAVTDNGAGATYVLDLALTGTAGTYAYPASLTTDAYGRVTAVTAGSAPVASGWVDDGVNVRLDTATDTVSIGTATPTAARKITVEGTNTQQGIRSWTDATTDNVLDTFSRNGAGPDDTSARLAISGAGNLVWTDGAGAGTCRVYRSGASTITFDNGASGSAVWSFLGTTVSQRTQYQTVTTAASPYVVLGTDNQVFANPGAAQTITLPAAAAAMLGRTITIKRVNTSANVVTVNTSGGNIDGAATRALAGGTYDSITVTCALVGGVYDWYII